MKRLSILTLVCVMGITALAIPARRTGKTVTQADGSEIMVYQHGDENFHWQTNEKGEWIELKNDGFFHVVEALSNEQIEAKRAQSIRRAQHAAYPLNVAPRGLVILVNFADVAFETEKAEMDSMLVGEDYNRNYSYTYRGKTYNVDSKGSARQYFQDASNGQYNPQFDVIGPVTISNNMSYYGKNDSYGNDSHPEHMINEACKLADSECGIDFTQYDNDEDGYVDISNSPIVISLINERGIDPTSIESWSAYLGTKQIYHKDKTLDNCWKKYGIAYPNNWKLVKSNFTNSDSRIQWVNASKFKIVNIPIGDTYTRLTVNKYPNNYVTINSPSFIISLLQELPDGVSIKLVREFGNAYDNYDSWESSALSV